MKEKSTRLRRMGFDDTLLIIVTLPIVTIIMLLVFFDYNFNRGFWENLKIYLSIFAILSVTLFGSREIVCQTRKKYDDFEKTTKRIVVQLLLVLFYSLFISNILVLYFNHWLNFINRDLPGSLPLNLIARTSIGTITYALLITAIYETIYVISLLKVTITEKAKLHQSEMFFSVLVHDVKVPLRFLSDVSESIYINWDLISDEDRKQYSFDVKITILDLSNFISNYLVWLKISQHNLDEPVIVNLNKLACKIEKYFELKLLSHNNKLLIKIDPELEIVINATVLERLFSSLVENSCKTTSSGTILLSVEECLGVCTISCCDDGIGMPNEKVNSLRDFYTSKSLDYISSFHMSHLFIRDFTRFLGATVTIDSIEKKGTEIKLIMS